MQNVFFHNWVFYLNRSSIIRDLGLVFPVFLVCFSCVFFEASFRAIQWKDRVWSAKYSTLVASCVLDVYKKTWFLGTNQEHRRTPISVSFLWHFLGIVTIPTREQRFLRVPKRKNSKLELFFVFCLLWLVVVYLVSFFDKNSYLSVTHRFVRIKLIFSHVQPLVSNRPTCARFDFCICLRSILPPLSHEVLILEEELQWFSMAFNIFILHNL